MIPIQEYLKTAFYLLWPKNRQILSRIAENLVDEYRWSTRWGKTFVLMVGFTGSGKSTFLQQHPKLEGYFQIKTSKIHDRLNNNFKFLQDDQSVRGWGYWVRQGFTRLIRLAVLREACRRHLPIVVDSCNLTKEERQRRLEIPRRHGYQTIIVWAFCLEEELLRRLRERDQEYKKEGKPPTWVKLYQEVQKPAFEPPTQKEADKVISFYSGVDRPRSLYP